MGIFGKLFGKSKETKKKIRKLPKKYRSMNAGNVDVDFLYNYMWIIGNVAVNFVKDEVPKEEGKVSRGLHFYIKGTNNLGFLQIENSLKEKEKFVFKVGCYRKNTDRVYSNYMFDGTYDELAKYLTSDNARETWFEQLVQLSNTVDECR